MRQILTRALLVMCVGASLTLGACSKSSKDEPIPNNPNQPVNPDTPVADPENTVTVNLLVGMTSGESTRLGEGISIYVDAAHNLCCYGGEIIDMGQVSGLGNLTNIPTNGWKDKTAIVLGHGYILQNTYYGTYARLYVSDTMISTLDAIMGYTVKYQCPMTVGDQPIVLERSSLNFNYYSGTYNWNTDETQGVYIRSGNNIVIKSKPQWCEAQVIEKDRYHYLEVTVQPNYTGEYRDGTIVIGNSIYEAPLAVTQGTYGFE